METSFTAQKFLKPSEGWTNIFIHPPQQLTQALNNVSSFQSIRGEIKIDPDSHGLIQSYYHTEPQIDGDAAKVKVVGTLGVYGPHTRIS